MYRQLLLICLSLISLSAFSQTGNDGKMDSESYRPQFHFSPKEGWMSDPNGLVYYDGEYHLCYQHIPNGSSGQHWGHAISKDLLHWEYMPIALYPDSLGFIFSGCTVVDHNNTSGLGSKDNPPLIAIFTYHNGVAERNGDIRTESQAIAYSLDKGRSWIKYDKNPVIPNPGIKDFRDPKVIWNKQTDKWLMALAAGSVIKFYESENSLDWKYLSEFGEGKGSHVGPWECPDFFPLKVKGSGETKWVLLVSVVDFTNTPDRLTTATQYFIGDFDGKDFSCDQTDTLWIDHGKDCYAGVTFDNAPDNRRIFVAWMNSHQYGGQARGIFTHHWSGAATFPRELSLVKDKNNYRLDIQPVKEIVGLYGKQAKLDKAKIEGTLNISDKLQFKANQAELKLNFSSQSLPEKYGVCLKNNNGEFIELGFDKKLQRFYVDRTNATGVKFHDRFASFQTSLPYNPEKEIQWRILVDVSSVEMFVGDNQIVFSDIFFPSSAFDIIEIFTEGGTVNLKSGSVTELKSILK
ncbi:glycoside hydrolase family 32 protein [Prevotella sp. 10(H)]|uniref:glycoside hydrolase family 32 protein n=1 Tax=Prevotella sp. 10(H) TaxID=1158294 RepID=UPI00055B691C|nr:glycoside hydrolase family 32 protein [Prevotella sp. 10(H)]